MAGKPITMSQIKQLIRLHQQGKGIKYISRALSMSRNTVKLYIYKMTVSRHDFKELLDMEDGELEKKFLSGNPAYCDERFSILQSNLEAYSTELRLKGMTRKLLWEEYRQSHPSGYSYTQFCYHIDQHLRAKKPSMVLHHDPGDKLFIDFAGQTVYYVDLLTGEQINCQLFVACLPHSDYGFTMAVPSQKVEDFIQAINQSLHFFGGVPAAIVTDNLKSAVTKSSKFEPQIQETLAQLANHYGTTILPTRVYKPKDKALVENHVKLVYQRVLAPLRHHIYYSLTELNQALLRMNLKLNQTRMQQKDYSREEKFVSAERHLLKPLPTTPFTMQFQQLATVQKNNHVLLSADKHYYSVPYIHINQKAKILFTATQVSIWVKGEQVAVHRRNHSSNSYSTIKDHLCSAHQHYLDRSPQYYIRQANSKSTVLAQLITLIFTRRSHPEQLYKTCDGLIRLYRGYPLQKFEKACALAINCEQYNYTFVRNVLENNMTSESQDSITEQTLPSHDNVRGGDYYSQFTLNLD